MFSRSWAMKYLRSLTPTQLTETARGRSSARLQEEDFPMAYISKRNRRKEKEKQTAANNRAELIAAGFRRRDLLKMGLLTSAGMLIPKKGLSAHPQNTRGWFDDDEPNSPPTTPFQELMPRLQVLQPVPLASLNPAPTAAPNTAAGEARTVAHQA